MIKKCLSIAGSDSSGGAGIQADLKTWEALGCYGMTVITAITAQNTCAVKSTLPMPVNMIQDQLDSIFQDITPDAIKIGMLYSSEIIYLISSYLHQHAKHIPIVLDPVMVSTQGDLLLQQNAIDSLKKNLFPLASIITPNLPEAYALTNTTDEESLLTQQLLALGANAILLKGGHSNGLHCNDYFSDSSNETTFHATRINTRNTHGTGCTLSSAIAAYLARGEPLIKACKLAKQYIFKCLIASKDLPLGHGCGPLLHGAEHS